MFAWSDIKERVLKSVAYYYPSTAVESAATNEIRIESLTVKLEIGDITEAKADVLINSTDKNLDLSNGKLASALLEKAGHELQRECCRLGPLKVNHVVESKGYNLSCKKVYHCRCPSSYSFESLKIIIRKCLRMADDAGFTSVVIPSLGTEQLRYPPEDVVTGLVAAISCFLASVSERKRTSLQVVTLMVHELDKRSVKAFKEYFHENYTTREALKTLEQKMQSTNSWEDPKSDLTASVIKQCSEFPNYWEGPLDTSNKVELTEDTEEWIEVAEDFKSTLESQAEILEIIRVQNPVAYQLYSTVKKSVDKQLEGTGIIIERNLWHGTSEENVENITNTFFDRSFAGAHGTQYGRGCYFSTTSRYSHSYSSRSNNRYSSRGLHKTYHMIRARVITGEYCKGEHHMKSAPPKYNSKTERFNSVVDKLPHPNIYVTFQDASAYPEYIVKYRMLRCDYF